MSVTMGGKKDVQFDKKVGKGDERRKTGNLRKRAGTTVLEKEKISVAVGT